jgi:hypothetical protein
MKRAFIASGLLLLSVTVCAVDQLQLSLGQLAGKGLQLGQAWLTLDWSQAGQPVLRAEVASLQIGDRRIEKLSLTCEAFEILAQEVDCRRGQLSFRSDWLNADAAPAALRYHFVTGELSVSVSRLAVAGGQMGLRFQYTGARWVLDAELADTALSGVAGLLAKAGIQAAGFDFQGQLGGKLSVQGNAAGLTRCSWEVKTRAAGYSNSEGTQAAEALVLASSGSARPQGDDWQIQATVSAQHGMLYAEPVYLEFSAERPLDMSAAMQWRPARGELSVDTLAFDQPGVVNGRLTARLVPAGPDPVRKLQLDIGQARLPRLYTTWLQPWLAGTALEKLETEGSLQGRLNVEDGRAQRLQLQLDKVSLRDRDGQFAVSQLDGNIHWDSRDVQQSTLAWKGASLYQLQFGAARLALETRADAVKMQTPLVVSLFDGALHVEELELAVHNGQSRWLLDAMLTPVSMQAVSKALGWPPLSGTLSGMIPKVRYENGDLTLGGVLLVQAFDGDITVRNLHIREPLGLVPRLWADARIDRLDLAKLTEAFSFGRIEGRLDGHVTDLYMEAWQPVAFDASFATPADDHSRHRISQRAVDNISNLGGGGVAGAVSRSFLRFLEDFPYKQLGISCRLANGVCQMSGVAPAERGYYLVQGRFLPPRLDVIGYASEVDWASLVERLKSITRGQQPVVQ